MLHVINDMGGATEGEASVTWFCEKGPEVPAVPVAKAQSLPAATTSALISAVSPTATPTQATTRASSAAAGPHQPSAACAEAWAKCGGRDWTGPTCCGASYNCVEQGIF